LLGKANERFSFGTSMSRNCKVLNRILRKAHIPAQDSGGNILCNLPLQFIQRTF